MNARRIAYFFAGLALATATLVLGDVYQFFPPPGITYSKVGSGGNLAVLAPTSGVSMTANGAASAYATQVNGNSTAGQSLGLLVEAGTSNADNAALVTNQSGATRFFRLLGDGSFNLGNNGSTDTITGTATGAVTLNAPTTANAHTVISANGVPFVVKAAAGADGRAVVRLTNPAATQTWDLGIDTSGSSTLQWSVRNITGGGTPFAISATTNGVTIATPIAAAASLVVNGFAGSTPIQANAAAVGDFAMIARGFTAGRSVIDYNVAGSDKAIAGINSGAGDLITGSAAGAFVVRSNGTEIDLSADSGSTIELQALAPSGTNPTLKGRGPTAAALVDMTPDSGTFTLTYNGYTANPTGTAVWSKNGNQVSLLIPTATGTSNATTLTGTGLPAEITPTRTQVFPLLTCENNTLAVTCQAQIDNTGTLTFGNGVALSLAAWTNVGTKGIPLAQTLTYLLN